MTFVYRDGIALGRSPVRCCSDGGYKDRVTNSICANPGVMPSSESRLSGVLSVLPSMRRAHGSTAREYRHALLFKGSQTFHEIPRLEYLPCSLECFIERHPIFQ